MTELIFSFGIGFALGGLCAQWFVRKEDPREKRKY